MSDEAPAVNEAAQQAGFSLPGTGAFLDENGDKIPDLVIGADLDGDKVIDTTLPAVAKIDDGRYTYAFFRAKIGEKEQEKPKELTDDELVQRFLDQRAAAAKLHATMWRRFRMWMKSLGTLCIVSFAAGVICSWAIFFNADPEVIEVPVEVEKPVEKIVNVTKPRSVNDPFARVIQGMLESRNTRSRLRDAEIDALRRAWEKYTGKDWEDRP